MKVPVLNIKGSQAGRDAELPDTYFGIEPNDHCIYLTVKQYQANQRQGTHKTLQKSEVSGSTRKLVKQKGTGGARKGSIKNPLYPGGARIFGPQPHDYGFKLNKKVKDIAKRSALTYKARESKVAVVEDFNLDTFKTKNYAEILKDLGLGTGKSTLVLNEKNTNIQIASKNIPNTKVVLAKDLNTFDILNGGKLVFTESSLQHFSNN